MTRPLRELPPLLVEKEISTQPERAAPQEGGAVRGLKSGRAAQRRQRFHGNVQHQGSRERKVAKQECLIIVLTLNENHDKQITIRK